MDTIKKHTDKAAAETNRRADEAHVTTCGSLADLHQSIKAWKEGQCYELITRGLMLEILSPIADVVRGTWLQLMCCTLPKHLYP